MVSVTEECLGGLALCCGNVNKLYPDCYFVQTYTKLLRIAEGIKGSERGVGTEGECERADQQLQTKKGKVGK